MQNAIIDQLTSGGHKSIPTAHFPQAQGSKNLTIYQGNAKCNNQSVNQWCA
jgi:hypothetical protein